MKALAVDIQQTIKILLLGPGESGKSTVFKQMKIIQDDGGFTEEEKRSFQEQIYNNCVSQMRAIIEAAINLKIPLTKKESLENAQHLMKATRDVVNWTPELGNMIKELWADPGIQEVYKKRGQHYQLNDTTEYFMSNIDRINEKNFMPTEEDVLRVRVRSTGIEEAEFTFDKKVFKVIDVGGQRSERRKWIHCFDGVSAVLFCASLADYDLPLREDPRQNRLTEAISLFGEVCNSETFLQRTLIFFLNKTDLLVNKLPEHPLENWRKDYTPPNSQDPTENYKAASEFLKNLFINEIDVDRRPLTSLYSHFTCALDTKNIEVVIRAVRTTLLQGIIKDFGL
eukprot:TRINITY_DN1183_c0_g1_i1.p1 TRINITY_DN1183_c0_g1~~TRINITY_DN1183_c0_g1_i1.p1  ORF type:complete len:368 (-),score=69.60 TRINITY_DN1183_c0_g1_i1:110-1129(-)